MELATRPTLVSVHERTAGFTGSPDMLYCPKCGRPLDDTDGQLTCSSGDMRISEKLTQLIRRAAEATDAGDQESHLPDDAPCASDAVNALPASWYCPRCGVPLPGEARAGQDRTCTSCGYVLAWHQRYALVELQPHLHWPPRRPLTVRRWLQIKRARLAVWLRWGF